MPKELVEENDSRIAELDFDIDGFHNQKVVKGAEAYGKIFKRLLLMRKGTYPSMPEAGIDLGSYRFSDIDSLVGGTLKEAITEQASKYIPMVPMDEVKISKAKYKGDWILFITISLLAENVNITASFLQRKQSIISSQITVEPQKFINTKGS